MNLHNSCAWSLPIVSLRYSRRYRPCPREQLAACFNLMASCNGLFILRRIDGRSYYIEKPAISKRVSLPRPTGRRWETMQVYHVPTSNQYKLVAGYAKIGDGEDEFIYTYQRRGKLETLDGWAYDYSSLQGPNYFAFRPFHYSFDTRDNVLTLDVECENLIEHELPEKMKQLGGVQTVQEFSPWWKGFTATIFYDEVVLSVFVLEYYECNKWVSKDIILCGFIDRFREVKQDPPLYSYHILTDDEVRQWFQTHDGKIHCCRI